MISIPKLELLQDNKTISITTEIINKELYEMLNEFSEEERFDIFISIINVGTQGMKRMKLGADIEIIEKKVQQMLTDMDIKLASSLDSLHEETHLGIFIKRLKDYFDKGGKLEGILDPREKDTPLGKFLESLKDYFDSGGKIETMLDYEKDSSPLSKFSRKLDDYFSDEGKLVSLLSLESEDSPISIMRKEITEELQSLRDIINVDKGKRTMYQRGTQKGIDFEDFCEDILRKCNPLPVGGDKIIRVGTGEGNITNSKKGDILIELENGKKIILEAKDTKPNTLSTESIRNQLNLSLANRNANYAILVSKYFGAYPKSLGWFKEIDDNKLVCSLGDYEGLTFSQILYIAYGWAKMKLEHNLEIDDFEKEKLKYVKTYLNEINKSLNNLDIIKTKSNGAIEYLLEINSISDEMRLSIDTNIKGVLKIIGSIQ